jgi:enamine deaminase RidA (YjgF/YER057c/UK114 family)
VVVAAPFDTYHLVQAHTTAAKSPNDTVYLSAAAGSGKGIREQTASALKSIERQLARHGMTFADTLEAVVWLRDPRHAGAMNQVYREIVKPKPAARATVRLAATDPDVLIQIVMSAHK